MSEKKLYIIAGPNGAGKTTASMTVLPRMLGCVQFVNADEIARGLSPLAPESVAVQAGRIMLRRIDELLERGESFALETTLATRSYHKLIHRAHCLGYSVTVIFIYLASVEQAIERVAQRVAEGGHDIELSVIRRRYELGLRNFFQIYIPITDDWLMVENTTGVAATVASKYKETPLFVELKDKYKNKNGRI